MPTTIRIATRASTLALWQAHHVKDLLEQAHAGIVVEICGMTTQGDRNKVTPLSKIGGKGVFVKELETALMDGTADIAVHSMKDVPAILPAGLGIHAICKRADPRDAFVSNQFASFAELPAGAKVGTSSLRRRLQVQQQFPHLAYPELRGNVDTRLRKLDEGEYDAIILASAGLIRLGLESRITAHMGIDLCLPAAGQGAVGIECRTDAGDIRALLAPIDDVDTSLRVHCERTVSAGLGANCTLPIAAFAELTGDQLRLTAFVCDRDGHTCINVSESGARESATEIADNVVAQLGHGPDLMPASLDCRGRGSIDRG